MNGHGRVRQPEHASHASPSLWPELFIPLRGLQGQPQGCAPVPLAASCTPTSDSLCAVGSPSTAGAAEHVSGLARAGRPPHCFGRWGGAIF